MKREIELAVATRIINNGPVVILGTANGKRYNGSSVAWAVPTAKTPPSVAIYLSPTHLSWENIKASGDFTLNVPDKSLLKEVAFLGGVSGRNADKLRYCGLQAVKGREVGSPFFPACLAHLECKVISMDEDAHLVRGEIAYALADETAFYDHWRIDSGIYPLHHLGGEFYECGGEKLVQPRIKYWPQKEE